MHRSTGTPERIAARAWVRVASRLSRLLGSAAIGACASRPPAPAASAPSLDLGKAPPGVRVVVTYHTYPITASTLREMRQAIAGSGPMSGGRRWDGVTNASLRWQYAFDSSPAGCRIRDERTNVDVRITMPEWRPDAEADEGTKLWWARYHAALMEHERGHGRLAVEAAAEIVRQLRLVPVGSRCEEVSARAGRIGPTQLQLLRARQAQYDRETNHGAVQIREATRLNAGAP